MEKPEKQRAEDKLDGYARRYAHVAFDPSSKDRSGMRGGREGILKYT